MFTVFHSSNDDGGGKGMETEVSIRGMNTFEFFSIQSIHEKMMSLL